MFPEDPAYNSMPNHYLDGAKDVDVPTLFVTGDNNKIFTDSNIVTFETLNKLKPGNHNELKIIPNYGHQDTLQGKNAARDVFPFFLEFLQKHSKPKTKAATS
jgi:cholesterol oxidase